MKALLILVSIVLGGCVMGPGDVVVTTSLGTSTIGCIDTDVKREIESNGIDE